MEAQERARARRKAAAAGAAVALAVLALAIFPMGATDAPVRGALWVLGACASGPFSPLLMFELPYQAMIAASALWPLYFCAVAFTRLGLVGWGWHLGLGLAWNFVGLWFSVTAGLMVT